MMFGWWTWDRILISRGRNRSLKGLGALSRDMILMATCRCSDVDSASWWRILWVFKNKFIKVFFEMFLWFIKILNVSIFV